MSRVSIDERFMFHNYLDKAIDKLDNPKNRNKTKWNELSTNYLFKGLKVEVAELEMALCDIDENNIIDECLDILNYTLFIIDNELRGKK